jgi:hypothetical protein
VNNQENDDLKYNEGYRESGLNKRRDHKIVTAIEKDLIKRSGGYIEPIECYMTLKKMGIRSNDYDTLLRRLKPMLEERGIYLWM